MNANLDRGRANFGPSADNMSAIVLYLFPVERAAAAAEAPATAP